MLWPGERASAGSIPGEITLYPSGLRLSSHARAAVRACDAERCENTHPSRLPVPLCASRTVFLPIPRSRAIRQSPRPSRLRRDRPRFHALADRVTLELSDLCQPCGHHPAMWRVAFEGGAVHCDDRDLPSRQPVRRCGQIDPASTPFIGIARRQGRHRHAAPARDPSPVWLRHDFRMSLVRFPRTSGFAVPA